MNYSINKSAFFAKYFWEQRKFLIKQPSRSTFIKRFIPITLFIVSIICFNNTAIARPVLETFETNEEWTLIQTVDNVKFYYQSSQCHGQTFLIFKVVNGNTATVHGSWQIKVQNGTQTRMCVGVLRPTAAGGVQAGACDQPDPEMVVPFMNLDPSTLQLSVTARITAQ